MSLTIVAILLAVFAMLNLAIKGITIAVMCEKGKELFNTRLKLELKASYRQVLYPLAMIFAIFWILGVSSLALYLIAGVLSVIAYLAIASVKGVVTFHSYS